MNRSLTTNQLAISMAASWAWGASLAVGIAILLSRGAVAWLIWTGFNVAAIPVFAIGYRYLPDGFKGAPDWKIFWLPMVMIQVFAVWMNLQAIFEISTGRVAIGIEGVLGETTAMVAVMGLGLVVLAAIYVWGFFGSAISDQVQYWGMLAGLVAVVVLGAFLGGFKLPVWESSADSIDWAILGGFSLLAGPYMDAMQWERMGHVPHSQRVRAGLLGGLYFAAYTALIGLSAMFLTAGPLVVGVLLMTSLLVDSSTLDSAVSAKQFLFKKQGLGRKTAGILTLGAILTWPFILDIGAVGLWTFYATNRLWICLFMIAFFAVLLPMYRRARVRSAA